MESGHYGQLQRGLKNRHIQLIALGGAIGTGLFLGSAGVMKTAGPSMVLGYAIGGLIAFLIMRQLGEMIVHEPVAGSFSHFAYKYWGDFAGFFSGWNYWALYVLVSMAELTAVAIFVQFWWPDIPPWVSVAAFFLLINAINLANVRLYGEMEFWFAIIKVVAVISMILLGGYLLLTNTGGEQASISNLWAHGGFFPMGLSGLLMAMAIIMFSFGGLELVGIAAAETSEPSKTIPRAINQVLYRILIFYIGALTVLLALYPWNTLVEIIGQGGHDYSNSPFVLIFSQIGIPSAAHILNFVVLTAALSVYNSCVYCNSRMLYGLALQGNGPKVLMKVDRRGVPIVALFLSSAATLICVAINYLAPKEAMVILMSLVVAALVINWAMISLAHLKFRAAQERAGVATAFKAFWYPFGNYLCIAFVVFILVIIMLMPGMAPYQKIAAGEVGTGLLMLVQNISMSVIAIPFWVLLLWMGFQYKRKVAQQKQSTRM
ncbi:MAG: amino acid permease [Burkholderiales bacterium]|jgi:aromatic amino acid transport protein AroP|nr:amino acid permease [Burkholderiales bacterium]